MTERIVVERAEKSFGNVRVLAGLDLAVQESEALCIIGPSGCGKTTLLRVMDGLVPLDAGRVLMDGQQVDRPRPNITMVFQHFGLFPWKTVEQNVAYGLEVARVRESRSVAARYVRLVGLDGFERAYPYQLSGGMQQRVGLARALALEPDILLMDEPFGSLDAQTRELMQDELLRIWEGARRTMVFITHSIDEAIAIGDRVVILSARPARVREVVAVDIPRPRTMASVIGHPRFLALRDRCWRLLREEAAA